MSVAKILGVESPDTPSLRQAREKWSDWAATEPVLAVVDDLLDLPAWTRTNRDRSDDVLRALAKLGSPTGGDDPVATTTLAWLLIPGAVSVARSLADRTPIVDELVASYLWSSARTFGWERERYVALTILRQTRRGVQAEVGIGEGSRRADRSWSVTDCIDPASPAWELMADEPPNLTPADDLLDLMDDAGRSGVLAAADRRLLIDLAVRTTELEIAHAKTIRKRGSGGILGHEALSLVGRELGVSASTVQRRAARSLTRLVAFANAGDRNPVAA